MTKDMTEGNPFGLIVRFAIPLLIGNLLQQGYSLIDAAIVGRYLGSEALGAVGASSSLQFLVIGFCIGTCVGFAVPIAQRFGARDYESMRRYEYHSFVLTAAIALILTVVCTYFCADIMTLLKTPDDIFTDANSYMFILFLGLPCTLLYNLTSSIMRAVGDSKTPFLFLAFSSVLNIFLDIFCITVLHMGCAGAALATIVAQGISGVLCLVVLTRRYDTLKLRKEEMHLEGDYVKDLVLMGLPMGLQYSITAIGSMVMQAANNNLGTVYVSAFTAASRLKMFGMCPFDAIATAASTFAGQNVGAGKIDRVKKGVFQAVLLAVIYGALMGVIFVLFGRELSYIFLEAKYVKEIAAAKEYLYYSGFFFWLLGILNPVRLCVQGLGFSGRAIFSGVIEMIARCAMSFFAVPVWGFLAICLSDQAAWISAVAYIVPTYLICIKTLEKRINKQ